MNRLPLCALLLAVIIAGGCRRNAEVAATAADTTASAAPACCAGAPAAAETADRDRPPVDGASVYALASPWQDQEGHDLHLADLAGRVRVVTMIFTHCQYACPMILAELRELEQGFGELGDQAPGVVLVSFDAARDDPATLKAYAGDQKLDPSRWTLLHGAADDVRELSVVLDVPYRADADGNFSHASVITVLDRTGHLVFQKRGLGGDLTECRQAIATACAAPPRTVP